MHWIIALFLAVFISLLGFLFKALSLSGALTAVFIGIMVFGYGDMKFGFPMITFFVSSSLVSRTFRKAKLQYSERWAKGSRRDWGQVLANGAFGGILALFYFLYPGNEWLWIAYLGAIAAVNADTWATELGILSPTSPRLVTTMKKVVRGTSGAISVVGSTASILGGLLIALTALFFPLSGQNLEISLILLFSVSMGSWMGSMVDSVLGASIQAIYYCPACQKETERYPQHICETPTTLFRGWSWLNNDWVNFTASVAGGLTSLLLWVVFL